MLDNNHHDHFMLCRQMVDNNPYDVMGCWVTTDTWLAGDMTTVSGVRQYSPLT